MAGRNALCFDNIPEGQDLRSPTLCIVLEQEYPTVRILGRSELFTGTSSMVIYATGNNLSITGDLPRRM